MNASIDIDGPLPAAAFGRHFAPAMAECDCVEGVWQAAQTHGLKPLTLHPATHALHYASSCFEGMKAFRHPDGSLRIFRLDRHVARLQTTARGLHLPVPPAEKLAGMIIETVAQNARFVPPPPGALYLRPTLFGTDVNIGGVTEPSVSAKLIVIACPVGDYFSAGAGTLTLQVRNDLERAVPGIAGIKAAANYASALAPIVQARETGAADQVLFCPGGDVQETGTSNFFLMDDEMLVTKPVSDRFLPGITRDSLLRLADDLGYEVMERNFNVSTLLDWIKHGEAALCGTAAVVTPVGSLIYRERHYRVNEDRGHPNVSKLAQALTDIQFGDAPDPYGWLSADVCPAPAPGTSG